ncbi:tyrosine-type recombinase/integrase [Bradyrhizobium iriomotense]|uniref:Integrase n=1 Tax=Bradyrhizobium iriomotense TaxID=441950 RepID=A0ABQ6B510_9BRAD|nr:tyrosine-type recombinase/integrase [Bradyrhizobium iriomotense]GLR89465.1 integrase [Bradyrhizobium iriomotense]
MPKLTKRVIDALRPDPTGKDIFAWDAGDGALKGFGVRMKGSGAACYLIQYRNAEGRTRRLKIASVATLTPDEARRLAGDRLREVAGGGDPSAQRRTLRAAISLSQLCDLYLEQARGRIKASTLAADRSRIETHVKPLIGHLTVRTLTTADVERMKSDIIAGKTAKPRKPKGRGGVASGGRGVAGRTLGMLVTILEYARKTLKIIKENPAKDVRRPPDGKQQRFLNIEEIAKLGQAVRTAEAAGESKTGVAAIRLLLLSGLRRTECLSLIKTAVDYRMHCLRLADSKSGAQLRPMGDAALRSIEIQSESSAFPWVFPASHGNGHFIGLPKILKRICKRAGLVGITVHVLRHSFAATAAEMGFSELTIAGLLGHRVPGVTARYAHVPDSALVAAANEVSARIAAALDGNTTSAASRPANAPVMEAIECTPGGPRNVWKVLTL